MGYSDCECDIQSKSRFVCDRVKLFTMSDRNQDSQCRHTNKLRCVRQWNHNQWRRQDKL